MSFSEEDLPLAKYDYFKTKNIPKEPLFKEPPPRPCPPATDHLLEALPLPKFSKKSKYSINKYFYLFFPLIAQKSSKSGSSQNIPLSSPQHLRLNPQSHHLQRSIPLSFGGFPTTELPEMIDINEFPEEQNRPNTPHDPSHIKNLGSYSYANANFIDNPPTMLAHRSSLLQPASFEGIEKKLEKINNELAGDRENKRSLQTLLSKIEQISTEKETLLKEMEKMKVLHEKRVENLKEELGSFNKLRLELEYKDQMYLNQKNFFEEELSRVEDEKAELEHKLAKIQSVGTNLQTNSVEEQLWRNKYKALAEDFAAVDTENKRNKQKIEELLEETRRKDEKKAQIQANYEQKLADISQQLLKQKPEAQALAGLSQENALLLKELTEAKLKLHEFERQVPDLRRNQEVIATLQVEIQSLKQEIERSCELLRQKNEEIVANDSKIAEFTRVCEGKEREIEEFRGNFLLICAENERLLRLSSEIQEEQELFIKKEELQSEIDEVMRTFLREREAFEAHLLRKNKEIEGLQQEIKGFQQEIAGFREREEGFLRKSLRETQGMEETREMREKFGEFQEKRREMQGIAGKLVLVSAENDRLFTIIEEKDKEIEHLASLLNQKSWVSQGFLKETSLRNSAAVLLEKNKENSLNFSSVLAIFLYILSLFSLYFLCIFSKKPDFSRKNFSMRESCADFKRKTKKTRKNTENSSLNLKGWKSLIKSLPQSSTIGK